MSSQPGAMDTATSSQPSAKDVAQKELNDRHAKAIAQLDHKLSCIPARVFHSNRKPTIMDVYTANANAIFVPGIPDKLQLDFIFENYSLFAASDFKALKSKGTDDINMAIWFWQMDQEHSFSRKHRQVRYNILMACILNVIPNAEQYVDASALEFGTALLDAWLWTVTRQEEYDTQARFLWLWVNGPYELMHMGRKQRDAFEKAMRDLEQYIPNVSPDYDAFWEDLKMTPKAILKKFGISWAIRHLLLVEKDGQQIDLLERQFGAEEALANESWMAGIGDVGLDGARSDISLEVFERPLVKMLMKEDIEDVDMDVAADEPSAVAWLDPGVALRMLQNTGQEYESMRDVFSKIPWQLMET